MTFNLKNKLHTGKLKSGYLINMTVLLLNLENPSMEMLLLSYQGGGGVGGGEGVVSKYVTTQPQVVEEWTPTSFKNGCYT